MSDYKKIILKNSPTAGAVPLPQFLDHGELALNYTDKKIYYKSLDGSIVAHETPNIDVNASTNSVVRRNLDGSGKFNGIISESTAADIYSIYATHNSKATAKIINTGVCTAAEISSDNGFGAEIRSIINTGASIYSESGKGASIHSVSNTGAEIYSVSNTGAKIYTTSGSYNALFGAEGSNLKRLGVSAPNQTLDWLFLNSPNNFTNAKIGKLQSAAITQSRTWTLPDSDGKILLDTALTDGSIVVNPVNFSGNLSGDVNGTQNSTFINDTTVTGKTLTNYAPNAGSILESDTILTAIGKLAANILLKADANNPQFTGTATGLTAASVGLSNVTNTSDNDKPVSTLQQTALNSKANIASPTFTGTVTLPGGTSSTAPVKLTSGTNLANPVLGALEFDGNNLYFTTNASTPTRNTIAFTSSSVPTVNGKIITVNASTGIDTRTGLNAYSNYPFATISAAVLASTAGDLIYVRAGTYTIAASISLNGKGDLYFEPGTDITVSGATAYTAFTCSTSEKKKICGYADFIVNGSAALVSLSTLTPTLYFECSSISGNASLSLFSTTHDSVLKVSVHGSGIDTTSAQIFSIAGNSKITAIADSVSCNKYCNSTGSATSRIDSTIRSLITTNNTSGIDIVSIGSANFYVDYYTHSGNGLACAWTQNTQNEKIAFINTVWYTSDNVSNFKSHISLTSTQASVSTKKIKLVGTNTFCGITNTTNSITSNRAVNIYVQNSYAATAANLDVTFKVGMFTVDTDINNFT